MKSWELSRNIIAFFQSYPNVDAQPFSFFSTVISKEQSLYQHYKGSFDNPELKADPLEILEELVELLKILNKSSISIDLVTNVNYYTSPKHQIIFEEYVVPMIQILSKYSNIEEMHEYSVDILGLKGLYHKESRSMISDVVNTVIYV